MILLSAAFCSCRTTGGKDTIAKLHSTHIEIKEEKIEGGLDKAMEGYRRFLEETTDSSPLKPEAIRRLADLKIEKEYGSVTGTSAPSSINKAPAALPHAAVTVASPISSVPSASIDSSRQTESQADFEKRASKATLVSSAAGSEAISLPTNSAINAENLERAGAREALVLYQKLLTEYPNYKRNDQVLYQMSRAYEELGQVDDAMKVMDRMVREYPNSRFIDEVQFRRGEYFYTRRHYVDAEGAYESVVRLGVKSSFYQFALYKLGWTYYKQEMYEESLDKYIALLDYKVSVGYDFSQTKDEQEKKRIDDTFRAISLCFSSLHGTTSVSEYFKNHGKRSYEDGIYSNLGEFYFDKRRYADAAAVYNAFVNSNPFHKLAPKFSMRVIEIHTAGAFPSLVIDSKKLFARNYGLKSEYWKHFEPAARPEVMAWLKTNLTDLAKHYHSQYQNSGKGKDSEDKSDADKEQEKKSNFEEAIHWYREFLTSFPKDAESPAINYLMADLLLENHSYNLAAMEYEKTAYEYPTNEKSAQAGYAAVYAYREYLKTVKPEAALPVKKDIVRSSLKFADTFPSHEKASVVLGAAADDLYTMKEYEQSVNAARKLITAFPKADFEIIRQAWLVTGHGTFELHKYSEAEVAYAKVLEMLPSGDKSRDGIVDNLAASIYKQGETANANMDYKTASEQFLRVGRVAPDSRIRANAEYDAAEALISLKDWKAAATVLTGFRTLFPGNALLPEVTKKIAYVYREDGQLSLAAEEYERMEKESKDDEVRREALLTSAELYETAGISAKSLAVYRRYVDSFPHPVEANLEVRSKIAEVLKKSDRDGYLAELKQIVAIDSGAGNERTARTKYLAGKSALVLAENSFAQFAAVKLVEPLKASLDKKKSLMKSTTQQFGKLGEYETGEVTAAATYYIAEIYADFSKSLKESERPKDLSALEREQYELDLEEQAYPFEEKAITTHKSNLDLIGRGVYNEWIDKSLEKLAKSVPARYDKPEEESAAISTMDSYVYAVKLPDQPVHQAQDSKKDAEPAADEEAGKTGEPINVSKPTDTKDELTTGETVTSAHDLESSDTTPAVVR